MKPLALAFLLCLCSVGAFGQDTASRKTGSGVINIKVPEFADPEVKSFYTQYTNHLVKCIKAIREKDEAKVISLFRDPGEQLVAKEKLLVVELFKNAAEKQKYLQFAKEVYPYIKELERSTYYQKLYGK